MGRVSGSRTAMLVETKNRFSKAGIFVSFPFEFRYLKLLHGK